MSPRIIQNKKYFIPTYPIFKTFFVINKENIVQCHKWEK